MKMIVQAAFVAQILKNSVFLCPNARGDTEQKTETFKHPLFCWANKKGYNILSL